MSKLARREVLAVAAVSLGFGFLFTYPILRHVGEMTVYQDFAYSMETAWAIWKSVATFHQLPLWNPYRCGGMPLLANPQAPLPSLFLPLHLIVGPFAGVVLEIPLHLSIGFAGAYFLARTIGCRPLAAVGGAIAFAGSSWFSLHASVGHEIFPQFVYLPWILALTIRAVQTRRFVLAALAGLVAAIAFGEGGIYPLLQGSIFLAIVLTTEIAMRRSLRPITIAIVVAMFGLGFAAIKLIPAWQLMSAHPRGMDLDSETLRYTLLSLFSRHQTALGPTLAGGFWEHGAYLSPAFAILGVVGIALARSRATAWTLAAIIFFVLAMGSMEPDSIYGWLHRLPEFSSTRGACRYLISFVLAASMLAALGIEKLAEMSRRARFVAASLVLIGLIDCFIVSTPVLRDPFADHLQTVPQSAEFRQFYDSSPFNFGMLPINLANLGALNCYEAPGLEFSGVVLGYNQHGYRGEQFIEGQGTANLVRWTPNVLTYAVNLATPGKLTINQNYDGGWRIVRGNGSMVADAQLLIVSLPAGAQTIELNYLPTSFLLGALISMLTGVAAIVLWRWERRRES